MKFVIPALQLIAERARKYAEGDPDLAAAYGELAQAEADGAAMREAALKSNGRDCVACGKRFLSLPEGSRVFCSIGCAFADP